MGYSPWGHKELATTDRLIHILYSYCGAINDVGECVLV